MDSGRSGLFQNGSVNETLELHVGDSFRVPKAFRVSEEREVLESLCLWKTKTKKKGLLRFVATFVETESLYLASSVLRIALLPRGQIFDPSQILELLCFFSHSLFDPKTARNKNRGRWREK